MKKVYIIGCLVFLAGFTIGCFDKTLENSEINLVSAEEMHEILELEDAQLIDIRTSKEYKKKHISNSQNIDFQSPTFKDDILKLDKKKPVIIYCNTGRRSSDCVKEMKAAGFEKVYDLEGGISKWEHSDKLEVKVKS